MYVYTCSYTVIVVTYNLHVQVVVQYRYLTLLCELVFLFRMSVAAWQLLSPCRPATVATESEWSRCEFENTFIFARHGSSERLTVQAVSFSSSAVCTV